MLITRLRGGLGNQMFQYAIGRVLAIKNSEPLKLDITGYDTKVQGDTPRAYRLHFFNIVADIASAEEVRCAKYPFGALSKAWRLFKQKVLKKHYVDWHPEILNIKLPPILPVGAPQYIDGFFQSEKYFLNNREVLLKDFSIKPEYVSSEMSEFKKIIEETPNAVSIHVRRGDYFANNITTKIHGVDLSNYYKEALALIIQKTGSPHFFVFSDDIEWVKQNLNIDAPKTYISSPTLEDYQELILMSLCDHHIIANSSFSWWGAWLNPSQTKIVVAPKQWTVKNTDHPNIIPDNWIKL